MCCRVLETHFACLFVCFRHPDEYKLEIWTVNSPGQSIVDVYYKSSLDLDSLSFYLAENSTLSAYQSGELGNVQRVAFSAEDEDYNVIDDTFLKQNGLSIRLSLDKPPKNTGSVVISSLEVREAVECDGFSAFESINQQRDWKKAQYVQFIRVWALVAHQALFFPLARTTRSIPSVLLRSMFSCFVST